jgi:hypothetical protein
MQIDKHIVHHRDRLFEVYYTGFSAGDCTNLGIQDSRGPEDSILHQNIEVNEQKAGDDI